MANKPKKVLSLEGASLYTRFVIASFFMFIIPLVLMLYVAFFVLPKKFFVDPENYTRLVILWMVVSGVFGYILIRKIAKNILKITSAAKQLSEDGGTEKISISEEGELKDLAMAFNRMTADLEKKIKELEHSKNLTKELFKKIGAAITSSQKIDALLNIIAQSARTVLRAEASLIALYDKKDNRLKIVAYSGTQTNLSEGTELPDDKGILGLVMQSGKPMMVEKSKSAEIQPHAVDEKILYDNILCVPIVHGGKPHGVLAIINKLDGGRVEEDDLLLLENLAVQIFTSIKNFELDKDIEDTYYQTLLTLAKAVEAKDNYSRDHLDKVALYVEKMADKLKLDEDSRKTLIGGALLHDLGKVGISDNILKKTDKLTPEEYEIMKHHSVIGENILRPLKSMQKLSDLVRHHHEHYDGTGYPDGLKGEKIPLLARILTIADIYDAITRDRPYRKASSQKEAVEMIKSYSGNKLDPRLVEIFLNEAGNI